MKWALDLRPLQVDAAGEDAAELVSRLLESKGRFSEADCNRVRGWLAAWVADAGERTLDECLGIKPGRGEKTLAWRLALARQRAAMVAAYEAQVGCDGMGHQARCKRLREEMLKFERLLLDDWLKAGHVPADCAKQNAAFYKAFTAVPGKPPPKTWEGISRLVTRDTPSGVTNR